jgi:hypothetical protein
MLPNAIKIITGGQANSGRRGPKKGRFSFNGREGRHDSNWEGGGRDHGFGSHPPSTCNVPVNYSKLRVLHKENASRQDGLSFGDLSIFIIIKRAGFVPCLNEANEVIKDPSTGKVMKYFKANDTYMMMKTSRQTISSRPLNHGRS